MTPSSRSPHSRYGQTQRRRGRASMSNCPARRVKHHQWADSLVFTSVALAEGDFLGVGHFDPLRARRDLGVVVVMPVPPLIWRSLRITGWRVFPDLLTPEGRDIKVTPDGPHRLVTPLVDEVCAEHPLAVANERVVAVPLGHTEVGVETVGDGVPGHLPAHSRFQARNIRLRRA